MSEFDIFRLFPRRRKKFPLHFRAFFATIGAGSDFLEKKKNNLVSVLRYVATGTSTWLLDNGLFTLLLWIFGDVELFQLLGFTVKTSGVFTCVGMSVGFLFSFFTNRAWTFQASGKVGKQIVRCFLLFVFNMVITAIVVNGVSLFGRNVLSLSDGTCDLVTNIAKYTMSGITGVWNYFIYQKWVYKE